MANCISGKTPSLLRRFLPVPIRPLFLPSAMQRAGICYSINRDTRHRCITNVSLEVNQPQGPATNTGLTSVKCRHRTSQNFDTCFIGTPQILNHQGRICPFVRSNLTFHLPAALENFFVNNSPCQKNFHTSALNCSLDDAESGGHHGYREGTVNVKFDVDNVSPEVNRVGVSNVSLEVNTQQGYDTSTGLTSVTDRTGDDVSLDTILTDSDSDDILVEKKEPKPVGEYVEPPLMPASLTLSSYVEHSEVLQKLVNLGVDLSKVENKKNRIAEKILKMNFDPDISEKISFLHFVGVESSNLGKFLTRNPHILLADQENLEKRVQYLMSKKFDQAAIAQIVNRAPYFLSFSVERLDARLGFYQQTFSLTGDELRKIVTTYPKLITQSLEKTKENLFVLKQQFGFYKEEIKSLVISHPRILRIGKPKLISIFDYLHNDMGISHKMIVKNYQVFNARAFHIQERHKFLESLGRAQYDPKEPGYVSLKRMVELPDDEFCQQIAMSNIYEYNNFLKTL